MTKCIFIVICLLAVSPVKAQHAPQPREGT